MKLYDTINGVFVSLQETTLKEVRAEIEKGVYSDFELENWTLEGDDPTESISLADIRDRRFEI